MKILFTFGTLILFTIGPSTHATLVDIEKKFMHQDVLHSKRKLKCL